MVTTWSAVYSMYRQSMRMERPEWALQPSPHNLLTKRAVLLAGYICIRVQ
jgi:hypothetical protein